MNSDLCLHVEKFWLFISIFYFILKIRIHADLWLWTLEINVLAVHLPPFQLTFHAIYHVKIREVGFIIYPITLTFVGSSLARVSSGILRESQAMFLYDYMFSENWQSKAP